ncbi:hypothetical protein GW17_00049664 [Ensete ventricosum]|nr:hypothetical protein GW17_00049664 [Ensete ventricosum]
MSSFEDHHFEVFLGHKKEIASAGRGSGCCGNRVRSKERQGGEAVAVRRCSGKGRGWKRLRQPELQRQGRRQRRHEEHPVGGEQQGSDVAVGASKGGGQQQWRKRAAVKRVGCSIG